MKYKFKELGGQAPETEFWVCDYRFSHASQKPIRSVPPTRVLLIPVLNPQERYKLHADFFFAAFGKDGLVSSKIIKPYDNTAYGDPLNVFDNEAECRAFYAQQHRDALIELEAWRKSSNERIDVLVQRSEQEILENAP